MPTLHLWQGDRPYGSISKELITHHRCQDLSFSAYMSKLQQGTHSGSYVFRSKKRETTISKTRKFVVFQIASFSKKKTKNVTRISATWISAKLWSRCAPAPRLLPCRWVGEQCAMLSQCSVIQTLHLLGTSLQQRSFPHVAATSWQHFWWKLGH